MTSQQLKKWICDYSEQTEFTLEEVNNLITELESKGTQPTARLLCYLTEAYDGLCRAHNSLEGARNDLKALEDIGGKA